jgi:hypothetical protein
MNIVPPRHSGDARPGLQALLDDSPLLGRRPSPPSLRAGQNRYRAHACPSICQSMSKLSHAKPLPKRRPLPDGYLCLAAAAKVASPDLDRPQWLYDISGGRLDPRCTADRRPKPIRPSIHVSVGQSIGRWALIRIVVPRQVRRRRRAKVFTLAWKVVGRRHRGRGPSGEGNDRAAHAPHCIHPLPFPRSSSLDADEESMPHKWR